MPRKLFAFIVIATLTGASCVPLLASPSASEEIRAVIQAQQQAWNRGDIDGFMNGYAHRNRQSGSDSTTFVSEDAVTRGWQTVRDRYKKKYGDRAKMGTLTFSELQITPVSAESAIVLGRWKLIRAKDQPHGRFTLIFKRLPEGWRIIHDHTSAANARP